jgi:protein SCO1/2
MKVGMTRSRALKIWFFAASFAWVSYGGRAVQLAQAAVEPGVERLEAGPKELEDVGVDEHLGAQVPINLPFVDSSGEHVALSQYVTGLRPVLLTLNYADCPMLCNLQLDGLLEGLREMSLNPGQDFEIVTVSIDPNEQLTHTKRFKDKYIAGYGRKDADKGWHFLTGSLDSIEKVARAVGFKYTFVPERKEYAHTAVVMVLSPDGMVSRYLYGVTFAPRDLRLAVLEASEGKIGSTLDRILLYCFHYDATVGRYSAAAANIMRLAGALTVLLLGGTLGLYWLKEFKTKRVPRG